VVFHEEADIGNVDEAGKVEDGSDREEFMDAYFIEVPRDPTDPRKLLDLVTHKDGRLYGFE
jgi:hypothetical protein